VGSVLLGAGIAGLSYNLKTLIAHQQFSWGGWATQLGIGGVTGLIGGGFAAGASMGVNALMETYQIGRLAYAITGVANTIGGAASGAAGQVLSNWAAHTALTSHLGFATLLGLGLGVIAGGMGPGFGAARAASEGEVFGGALAGFDKLSIGTFWESSERALQGSLKTADSAVGSLVDGVANRIGYLLIPSIGGGSLSLMAGAFGWQPKNW